MAEKAEAQRQQQPGFEQMARSIHGSYLRRWNRHDPRALTPPQPDADPSPQSPEAGRSSAA